jgi:metal-dependent amidase/aminoacylase/carboxypeptidase family protein
MRALTRRELTALKSRVVAVAEAAAMATGARLEWQEGLTYADRRDNPILAEAFARNIKTLGERVEPPTESAGSSDMGNVGEVCPMIHPYIGISEKPISGHSVEFVAASGSDTAMRGMLRAAKALAMTVVDLCYDEALFPAVRAEHARSRAEAERGSSGPSPR